MNNNKLYDHHNPNCDVRMKGTNIYVRCSGVGIDSHGNKGIICEYQNGPHKGASEVIPGDCLIEEYK